MKTVSILTVLAFAGAASAQVGIDGVIGAEWSAPGVTVKTVSYNPAAATSNFGTPGPDNHTVAYTTYFRADSTYVYAAVAGNPHQGFTGYSGLNFMNIYIGAQGLGSTVGLEVLNNNFFRPGLAGSYNGTGYNTYASDSVNGIIEVAIPISFFQNDPLAMGFATNAPGQGIRWNLSQSLGYSVAGGAANFGADRLGLITTAIPAPGAAGVLGLFGALAARRRR